MRRRYILKGQDVIPSLSSSLSREGWDDKDGVRQIQGFWWRESGKRGRSSL